MRFVWLCAMAGLLACSEGRAGAAIASVADTLPPAGAPAPIGLYGAWVRVAPAALRGDTLRLNPDSTATGVIPWPPNQLARISRWKVAFWSRKPVAAREDWRPGHKDGGEAACFLATGADARCRSLPVLCLGGRVGGRDEYQCEKFVFTPESLLFSTGLRYVRVPRARPDTGSPRTGVRS